MISSMQFYLFLNVFLLVRMEVNCTWYTELTEKSRKAPLTEEEKTLEDVRHAEAGASRGTSARSSHVSNGLAFPMSQEAIESLQGLRDGIENLVQLVY